MKKLNQLLNNIQIGLFIIVWYIFGFVIDIINFIFSFVKE